MCNAPHTAPLERNPRFVLPLLSLQGNVAPLEQRGIHIELGLHFVVLNGCDEPISYIELTFEKNCPKFSINSNLG